MPFLVAVPLIVVLTAFVALALAALAQTTGGAFVSWLTKVLEDAAAIGLPGLQAATDLARWIARKLGDHYEGVERLAVGWLAGVAQYAAYVITFALKWPIYLFTVLDWLVTVEIPRIAKGFTHTVTRVAHTTVSRVVRIERTIVKLPKLSRKQASALIGAAVALYVHPYLSMLRWLRHNFHALVAVLPHVLPIPFGRTIAQIKRRLRHLEREGLFGTAAAAAVAIALSRLGLGWLRCSALRRLGKRIGCGGFGLLETFFADAFEVFLVTQLCEFIYLLSRAAEALRPELLAFVDVENVLIGCHGNMKPADLTYTSAEPPPVTVALKLAA